MENEVLVQLVSEQPPVEAFGKDKVDPAIRAALEQLAAESRGGESIIRTALRRYGFLTDPAQMIGRTCILVLPENDIGKEQIENGVNANIGTVIGVLVKNDELVLLTDGLRTWYDASSAVYVIGLTVLYKIDASFWAVRQYHPHGASFAKTGLLELR